MLACGCGNNVSLPAQLSAARIGRQLTRTLPPVDPDNTGGKTPKPQKTNYPMLGEFSKEAF